MSNSDKINRIREIQASMVKSAESCFDQSELGNLRAVIRLTVEFHSYLEHGSTEIARGLLELKSPHLKIAPDAALDPFNEYDLEYMCGSIRSGVDCFCSLNQTYKILEGSVCSRTSWSMISSRELLKSQFISMFKKFDEELNFEIKCRLLLDLFKLQMVFASISFN
jgi:hypothetical protein